MTSETDGSSQAEPLRLFVEHMEAARELADSPELAGVLGEGLRTNLVYLMAIVRARFPQHQRGAQQSLLP